MFPVGVPTRPRYPSASFSVSEFGCPHLEGIAPVEFRLLGTVSVDTRVGPLPLGPAKRRSLLAALLLSVNTPVPVTRLTDCLWDDAPPLHARGVIQGHVSRLRALLAGADAAAYGVELATLGDAYAMRSPETLLDSQRFEELLALARGQQDPRDAVLMLKDALSLWQGPALAGAFPGPPLQAAAHSLEESRTAAVEQLAHAHTALGEHDRAAAVLRTEAVVHPMREPLAASLMTALYRAGRQSEALAWFHRTRRLLVDELGVDPGRELAQAYALILRGDPLQEDGPGVAPPTVPSSASVSPPPRDIREAAARQPADVDPGIPGDGLSDLPPRGPKARADDVSTSTPARSGTVGLPTPVGLPYPTDLLPRAPRGFQGRQTELAALTRAAAAEAPVCLVTGLPGVGKTALALQWAHRNAGLFPDGRLFADLRGFGDTGEAALIEVLREFLCGARCAPATRARIGVGRGRAVPFPDPPAPPARHPRQRPRLRDRPRAAAGWRRLRHPGHQSAPAGRPRRLRGRHRRPAGQPRTPGRHSPAGRCPRPGQGAGRTDGRAQARRTVRGLPLALRVTAARLAGRPQRTLADLADELADERCRLRRIWTWTTPASPPPCA